MSDKTLEVIVSKAIKVAGGRSELARRIGVTKGALYFWKRIPAEKIVSVSKATGIPPEDLRPDLAKIFRQPS